MKPNHRHKKYVITVAIIIVITIFIPVFSLFIVDPLSLFHKPWIRDNYFVKDLRFQAAGIINNSDFDSIILGTSMAANFSANEASAIWGSKFVNISPDGAWLSDRALILDHALREKELKNVIVTLDEFSEYGKRRSDYLQDYLYNESSLDDIKAYLGTQYIKFIFCGNRIFSFNPSCRGVSDLESAAEWYSNKKLSKRFGGINKWIEAKNDRKIRKAFKQIAESLELTKSGSIVKMDKGVYDRALKGVELSFDEHVFSYIKENPDTGFYLYFPPYSRMKYALWKQTEPEKFELYLKKIRYAVDKLDQVGNARVFGFDHLNFTADIANYKDTLHHHPHFNSEILKWMSYGEYRLTNYNVEKYIGLISELAENYDIKSIGEKIAKGLDE